MIIFGGFFIIKLLFLVCKTNVSERRFFYTSKLYVFIDSY